MRKAPSRRPLDVVCYYCVSKNNIEEGVATLPSRCFGYRWYRYRCRDCFEKFYAVIDLNRNIVVLSYKAAPLYNQFIDMPTGEQLKNYDTFRQRLRFTLHDLDEDGKIKLWEKLNDTG